MAWGALASLPLRDGLPETVVHLPPGWLDYGQPPAFPHGWRVRVPDSVYSLTISEGRAAAGCQGRLPRGSAGRGGQRWKHSNVPLSTPDWTSRTATTGARPGVGIVCRANQQQRQRQRQRQRQYWVPGVYDQAGVTIKPALGFRSSRQSCSSRWLPLTGWASLHCRSRTV